MDISRYTGIEAAINYSSGVGYVSFLTLDY